MSSRKDVSSRGEPSSGNTRKKLTVHDAVAFLKTVKATMSQDQKEEYDAFLDAMKDFKEGRLSAKMAITKAKELLKGHDDLLLGFSSFLPKAYQEITTLPLDGQQRSHPQKKELADAIKFVTKVKDRFGGNGDEYKSFIMILELYKKNIISSTEIYNMMDALFKDHADLLQELTEFYPRE